MENNKAEAPEASEQPRKIWEVFDVQQGSINGLVEIIDALNVRLNPLMSDSAPKEELTEDTSPASTMTTRVIDHTSQIDAAVRRLRDIDERLDI